MRMIGITEPRKIGFAGLKEEMIKRIVRIKVIGSGDAFLC